MKKLLFVTASVVALAAAVPNFANAQDHDPVCDPLADHPDLREICIMVFCLPAPDCE
ncbi:hypothetical protein [Bradyrhizobium jicamae]|uniref:hypothetical protein n=1 Tax=Bradyrhizobium jicamae TaxID=280332 RepID=UPI0012EEC3CF|nr:hypothetical protein [Bradyrhizobium jicamae]